jgi:hypothetical protein
MKILKFRHSEMAFPGIVQSSFADLFCLIIQIFNEEYRLKFGL